ncbi:MAG: S-formylglutathione hydrolase [Pseudomonadota bacterium]
MTNIRAISAIMQIISEEQSFGGTQGVYEHASDACRCSMRFGLYRPPTVTPATPVVFWLSGLTCTEQNFITKAGAQRLAAELGVAIVAPDTSPRGDDVPTDPDGGWDFGHGAGFYVDATEAPWSTHYRMGSYISDELPTLIAAEFGLDTRRVGICGHSMGGHGALITHFRCATRFVSVSAFAPIVAPTTVPWGQKALAYLLGENENTWAGFDATALVATSPTAAHILIDQGSADPFLDDQLQPQRFIDACRRVNQPLTLRMRDGYTHSYYFVASFIDEHLRHHVDALTAFADGA